MNIVDRFLAFSLLGAEWVMWVLIVLSLISITIMIERLIYFIGQRTEVQTFGKELAEKLRDLNPQLGILSNCGGGSFKSQMKKAVPATIREPRNPNPLWIVVLSRSVS